MLKITFYTIPKEHSLVNAKALTITVKVNSELIIPGKLMFLQKGELPNWLNVSDEDDRRYLLHFNWQIVTTNGNLPVNAIVKKELSCTLNFRAIL